MAANLVETMAGGGERLLDGTHGEAPGNRGPFGRPRGGKRHVEEGLTNSMSHERCRAIPDVRVWGHPNEGG